MDRFEGVTSVRLRGAHGKYLWAEQDQYGIRQENEDKNLQAVWRVERSKTGTKALRFKSCFDTYLTASEQHYRGIGFLSFAGKRVTQMRPENVESTNTFDWEPVIDKGQLKLKSCHGTYLRANSNAPPWNSHVTHDLPQHERHLDWLVWEVGKVVVPNITPLELVIGSIHLAQEDELPAQEKSKHPDEIPARTGGESRRHHVQEPAKHPDAPTARRANHSERHLEQEKLSKQGTVPSARPDESDEHFLEERPGSSDVGGVGRAERPERQPVHDRERDSAVGMITSAVGLRHEGEERRRNPAVGSVGRSQQRIRDPDVLTPRRTENSEGHSGPNRSQDSGVSSDRITRANESSRHSVHERKRNLVLGTTRSSEESEHNEPQRPQSPDTDAGASSDESDSSGIQERARMSVVVTSNRTDDLVRPPARERFHNPGVSTFRRADESQRPLLQERDRNPNVGTPIRTDNPERPPVQKRYEKYRNPGVSTARRAQDSEGLHVQEAASRDHGSKRLPVQQTTRRAQGLGQRPVQETAERDEESEIQKMARRAKTNPALETGRARASKNHPAPEKIRNPEVSTAGRTNEMDPYSVQGTHETLDRARRVHKSDGQSTGARFKAPDMGGARNTEKSARNPLTERERDPGVDTDEGTDESEPYPVYYPEEDKTKHSVLNTFRRADEITESQRKENSKPQR